MNFKTIYVLICVVTMSATAAPLTYTDISQEPTIRLSNGRVVSATGPGVICDQECASVSLPESTTSRKWLYALSGGALVVCAVLCRSGHSTPTGSGKAPVPSSDVSEIGTLTMLGAGLAMLGRRLRGDNAGREREGKDGDAADNVCGKMSNDSVSLNRRSTSGDTERD